MEHAHKLVIGSRGSDLALAQTRWIRDRILETFPDVEVMIRIVKTSGDKDTVSSIRTGSSVGVFVKELEQALLSRDIDLAVHSMKDVPTGIHEGLCIAAIPEREDVRDALIMRGAGSLDDLPRNSRVGTGSVRRQAQLLRLRPDLEIADLRGNLNTRIKKLDEGLFDAVILACAGLNRLNLRHRITQKLELAQMLPAPGQGALALETRSDDARAVEIAGALNDAATSTAVRAERAFLGHMQGGCNVPIAAYARVDKEGIDIDGLVISPDGGNIIRDSMHGNSDSADKTAVALAERLLKNGGRAILEMK